MGANGKKEYRDHEHISDNDNIYEEIKNGVKSEQANKLSTWLREKEWGVDVRESLALFVQWLDVKVNDTILKFKDLINRQNTVEKRQTDIEREFKEVIANATVDSEVINARDSSYFGKFKTLDTRLENIEKYITGFIPKGCLVTIKRKMNASPSKIRITSYDYGVGIVPLGTEPKGLFGGTPEQQVQFKVMSWENNTLKMLIPLDYADYKFYQRPLDGRYTLINGNHCMTIYFDEGQPVGDQWDKSQLTIEKTKEGQSQSEILTRLANIEERIGD